MGHELCTAVLERSRQSGSALVVLAAVGFFSDHTGEWLTDQATLQRRTRLGRRRLQQILVKLIEAGELAVTPGLGRGHHSSYRLLLPPENVQHSAPLPEEKGEAECTFSGRRTRRRLSGSQRAVHRVNRLLAAAGIPRPRPAQAGLWVRTLGGITPLLKLLRGLLRAGLATKRSPVAYIHRVVMSRADPAPEPC